MKSLQNIFGFMVITTAFFLLPCRLTWSLDFDISNLVTPISGVGSIEPSISGDGKKIAFVSYQDLVPGQNADDSGEVFLKNNGVVSQITSSSPEISNYTPTLSSEGNCIVFFSSGNYTNNNPDGNIELFRYRQSGGFDQITDTQDTGDATYFLDFKSFPSADCSVIAFTSSHDLTGGNPDKNEEVFVYREAANDIQQITTTSGPQIYQNQVGGISGDGGKIVFTSKNDFVGNNSDGNTEVFVYELGQSRFQQITQTADPLFGIGNAFPVINKDGNKIAFVSGADITGQNSDHKAAFFIYEFGNGFKQIIKMPESFIYTGYLAINLDGTRLAFSADANPVQKNADLNSEIFLYDQAAGITQITQTNFPYYQFGVSMDDVGKVITFDLINAIGGSTPTAEFNVLVAKERVDGSPRQIPTADLNLVPSPFSVPQQVTRGSAETNLDWASMSDDSRKIAYISNMDPLGQNPDLNHEVFMKADGVITQITQTVGQPILTACRISRNGESVVFVSTANLTNENSDGNPEVFQYKMSTGIRQITNSVSTSSNIWLGAFDAFPSPDGKRIVLSSSADYNGKNADGSYEIFLYDEESNRITQITESDNLSQSSIGGISADGDKIAFRATGDFAGLNPDHSGEVFVYEVQAGLFRQVTNTVSPSISGPDAILDFALPPMISGDGKRIIFQSNLDIGGDNPDRNMTLYSYDDVSGLKRIAEGGSPYDIFDGDVDYSGKRVVFASPFNGLGNNGDLNFEVFLYEEGTGFSKITDSSGENIESYEAHITSNGKAILFQSSANLLGLNSDNSPEVFVFSEEFHDPGPTPDPGTPPGSEPNANQTVSVAEGQVVPVHNVFRPRLGETVTVNYNPASAGRVVIKLYTINGELVKTLLDADEQPGSKSVDWSAVNDDSKTVASGIYLLHVEAPGIKTTKKIAVIK